MSWTVNDFLNNFEIPDDANVFLYSAAILDLDPDCVMREVFRKAQIARCKGSNIKQNGPLFKILKDIPVRNIFVDTDANEDYSLLLEGNRDTLSHPIVNALSEYMDRQMDSEEQVSSDICF